jgi:hypothetical protein
MDIADSGDEGACRVSLPNNAREGVADRYCFQWGTQSHPVSRLGPQDGRRGLRHDVEAAYSIRIGTTSRFGSQLHDPASIPSYH